MTIYDRYCTLRDQKGVKDATVAAATGITKSTFTDWKTGRSSPKREKLSKIADYFGITLTSLETGKEDEKESAEGDKYYFNNETAEMAQKLFENSNLRVLFDAAQDASPEDLKVAYDMLVALKSKENKQDG